MEERISMDKFIEKFSLEGKKAIVTGGAKGLCNGMAQALHDAGADGGSFWEYSGYCGGFCEGNGKGRSNGSCSKRRFVRHGIVESVYNQCLEKLGGRVDILLNGAGIQYRATCC